MYVKLVYYWDGHFFLVYPFFLIVTALLFAGRLFKALDKVRSGKFPLGYKLYRKIMQNIFALVPCVGYLGIVPEIVNFAILGQIFPSISFLISVDD